MNKKAVFGCVTDPRDKIYLDQAVRLVASLRWFGGELSKSPFIVCSVNEIPFSYKEKIDYLGGEVHIVKEFHSRHAHSNKLRFLEAKGLEEYDIVALLDCDTLILQDPMMYLPLTGFAAKPADFATVTNNQLKKIFDYFSMQAPNMNYHTDLTRIVTYPYFNAGVCLFARDVFVDLKKAWINWTHKILQHADQLDYPFFFTDQVSLTLALTELNTDIVALPSSMNLPVHVPLNQYPKYFQDIDPIILHYHKMTSNQGKIKQLPLAAAWRRAQIFNERLEIEGILR